MNKWTRLTLEAQPEIVMIVLEKKFGERKKEQLTTRHHDHPIIIKTLMMKINQILFILHHYILPLRT